MKIQKYQKGYVLNPYIQEWGNLWRERMQPSASSKVLLKWNASGKKPKPETSQERTNRRIKEETKRTWRSDAADIAHGIGEGVLALNPYTAIPYYGAKVGQDILSRNVGWQTAVNASIPLFHLSPQAVGLREATNVALEDAANAGSKTARNWRVAREINLGIKLNTTNGRIEVSPLYFNSENNWYRISETPEKFGIMELGKNITTADAPSTYGTINGWRESMLDLKGKVIPGSMENEGYFIFLPRKLSLSKHGAAHGNTSQAAKGLIWGGTFAFSDRFPRGVIEGEAPSMINFGIDRNNFTLVPWEKVPVGGRIGFHTGEMPMSNLGWFQKLSNGKYTYEPIIPEKRISYQTTLLQEPKTSLKFFERKPSRISLAERAKELNFNKGYVESPRDITSDVGDLIAEGSERSVYTSKSNPNIVYKIEDAPLDNIKNIKIRKEIADDIMAPEATVGYYNRNGKYYRVTLLDKYKSWNPDDFDINYSPKLDLEIIDALRKAKWDVELGTYNGAPYARTASKNGIKIGNLEYFNWGRDSRGNLKLIDLYVYSLKQGGKMNNVIQKFKEQHNILKSQLGTKLKNTFFNVSDRLGLGDKSDWRRMYSDLLYLGILLDNSNGNVQMGVVNPAISKVPTFKSKIVYSKRVEDVANRAIGSKRGLLKLQEAFATNDARHANSGTSRIKNRLVSNVYLNLHKYPLFVQNAVEKEKLKLARRGMLDANTKESELIKMLKPKLIEIADKFGHYKKGGSIYIKPSKRGSFTKYCNGKVTNECIARGKRSPSAAIRKKATFAQNARRWSK